jgi:hypothetical protein
MKHSLKDTFIHSQKKMRKKSMKISTDDRLNQQKGMELLLFPHILIEKQYLIQPPFIVHKTDVIEDSYAIERLCK